MICSATVKEELVRLNHSSRIANGLRVRKYWANLFLIVNVSY